jgi:hypothetical protein
MMLMLPLMGKAHVALDYPVGGETFIVGETITIQWHIVVPHPQLNWDLFYSIDGGETWDTIQMDIPTSNLSYEWVIPNLLTSNARVQIYQDNQDQNYLDFSMDFTIAPNTNPPLLDAPASDLVLECNSSTQQAAIDAWLANHGGAAATNYCGELVWTNDYPGLSNGCGSSGTAIVTFTATDECGMTNTIATLTVNDTSPPLFEVFPSDMVLETDGQGNDAALNAWLSTNGGAMASDVCGGIQWSNNFSGLSAGCGTTGSVTVVFTATDDCGNSSSASSTFTILDQVAPVITIAAQDTVFECTALAPQDEIQAWLDNHGGADGSDIGGDIQWTHNYNGLSDGCGPTGEANVVFTATDECGNTSTTAATIAIIDQSIPAIALPALDTVIECDGINQEGLIQSWLARNGGAFAVDICSQVVWSHNYSQLSDSCGITGVASVIFTVADECGNLNTTTATLTTRDTNAPAIEVEALDATVFCTEGFPSPELSNWINNHGGAVANDLCGNVTWSNDFPFSPDTCSPIGVYDIHFMASDECGNTASTQASLTITDAISPGVEDHQEQLIKVYPNPAQEELFIDLHDITIQPKQIDMMDAFGNIVWSTVQITEVISVHVSHLPGGMYFLSFGMQEGIFFKKVILQ